MVPERGAVAGASDAGSNGDKRSAPFTIGGFWRGCENIGGVSAGISGAYRGAYRHRPPVCVTQWAVIAAARRSGIRHPSPSARRARPWISVSRDW
ncbi:hypothetical protein D7207_21945 [Burkholderia cepacia]|nr:hypothetical protein [Burkholderia cepacia]MBA9946633.1 hypothetical protein [Burkholderia cepacia]MBA9976877.1 hypothetical protein [Burkholderia cepacia]MBA9995392.1 hypothetical protein [Burkholderia cepacia]MBB0003350.1 hypothetical protein [Burkholderia cepacia]